MPYLQLNNAGYSVGSHPILEGINFRAETGETVSIIGASGSGKSTILKLCISSINPTEGDVIYDGLHVAHAGKTELMEYRNKTGFVFDTNGIINSMNIFDNLALPTRYHTTLPETEIKEIVFRAMDRFKIRHLAYSMPIELSQSELKVINFIRAYMVKNEIIFYDDPFTGLDDLILDEVVKQIEEQKMKGTIQIISTGSIRFSLQVADRVILLKKRTVLETIPAREFPLKGTDYIRRRLFVEE